MLQHNEYGEMLGVSHNTVTQIVGNDSCGRKQESPTRNGAGLRGRVGETLYGGLRYSIVLESVGTAVTIPFQGCPIARPRVMRRRMCEMAMSPDGSSECPRRRGEALARKCPARCSLGNDSPLRLRIEALDLVRCPPLRCACPADANRQLGPPFFREDERGLLCAGDLTNCGQRRFTKPATDTSVVS